MKKRTDVKPAEAPQKVAVSDRPLIDRVEQTRSDASYREYTLTDCERLAYIAKYGAPTRPYKPREGKEVMHLPKPSKKNKKGNKGA